MNRREALQSLAALASSAWTAEGWDPDGMEEWDPVKSGVYAYDRWEYDVQRLTAHVEGPMTFGELRDVFTARGVRVAYTENGVWLGVDGQGEGYRTGLVATISPDVAREVASALYMAAEEFDRRPSATEGA